MNALTHLFYVISTSLLIPVELGLIVALLLALRLLGATLREAILRRRDGSSRRELESALERGDCDLATRILHDYASASRGGASSSPLAPLAECAARLSDEALVDKRAADYENRVRELIARAERLAKISPALGLMGTLIPLGPALLGLAQGDLDTLAADLVVAFSTTVVGLAGALIASFSASLYRGWARRDFVLMNFALDRLTTAPHTTETPV